MATAKAIEGEVTDAIPMPLARTGGALEEQISLSRPPEVVLEEARRAAVALHDVLAKKPPERKVMMNGEQYLEFEDWQTVGRFYGITAREDGDAEYVQFGQVAGFKASAVAINAHGHELSRATAFCLNDEEKWRARPKYEWHMVLKDGTTAPEESSDKSDWVWEPNLKKGGNRPKRQRVLVGEEPVPLFQLSSMSQTRANAKVLRNVLAWVVVLAGYRPTPAEELDVEVRSDDTEDRAAKAAAPANGKDIRPKSKLANGAGLTGAQCSELWSLAVKHAKKTGATREIIVRDILAYLGCKDIGGIPSGDFDRVKGLIGEWEPGVNFAEAESDKG